MSEEECKTKDNFNNNSITQKEINILLQSKKKTPKNAINIYIKNNNNNNQDLLLSYGNYRIFTYDKNGDPLFLIGPDYAYFAFLFILNFIYFIFLSGLIITLSNFYVAFFGIILNLIQFISFIICGIKNPGLPKKEIQKEILLVKYPNIYKRCSSCHFIIDKSKHFVHCNTCGCCCEGYDHHCPWTSKCIGKGNIFYFNGMLFMVCVIFIYIIVAVICASPPGKKNKK